MKRHPSARAVLLLLVLAAGAELRAQDLPPPPTPAFRVGTDVVRLEVSVLDGQRQPVRGLTAADFTIREDGRERPVVAFASVELPPVSRSAPAAAWLRDAPREVLTNSEWKRRCLISS